MNPNDKVKEGFYPESISRDVDPTTFKFDYSYQRRANQRRVEQIANNFTPNMCQPLLLAKRADGNLYVVDGQHRAKAAAKAGVKVTAKIIDLTSCKDPQVYEAKMFVIQNRERSNLTGLALLNAEYASGDKTATAIIKTAEHFDFSMAEGEEDDFKKLGGKGAIGTLKRAHKHDRLNELVVLLNAARGNKKTVFAKYVNKEKMIKPMLEIITTYNLSEDSCEYIGKELTLKRNQKALERLWYIANQHNVGAPEMRNEVPKEFVKIWPEFLG